MQLKVKSISSLIENVDLIKKYIKIWITIIFHEGLHLIFSLPSGLPGYPVFAIKLFKNSGSQFSEATLLSNLSIC